MAPKAAHSWMLLFHKLQFGGCPVIRVAGSLLAGKENWGEDTYFRKCMDMLGVGMIADFQLVGDGRCMGAPCTDPWRAAFHPFKDVGGWLWCYNQSPKPK